MRLRLILLAALIATTALPQPPPPKVAVGGTVFDSDGHPLRGVRLALIPESDYLPFKLVTPGMSQAPAVGSDAEGRFTFDQVDPGAYRIRPYKAGMFPEPRYREGLRVKVIPGDQATGLRLTMLPGAVITGKVTDEDGDPFARATVDLLVRGPTSTGRPGSFWVYEVACDSFGEYRIAGVAPGSYLLSAHTGQSPPSKKEKYVDTFYGNTTDENRTVPLEVTLGATLQSKNIVIGKLPLVHVRGRIVGNVPANEQFRIDQGFSMTPNKDGTFETELTPGHYNVIGLDGTGTAAPQNAWTPIDVGYAGLDNVELFVSPFSLRGRVVVDDAEPNQTKKILAGFKVYLDFLNGPAWVLDGLVLPLLAPNAPVNSDGTFVLNRLIRAEYKFGSATSQVIRSSESQFPHGTYVASIRLGDKDVSAGIDLKGGATSDLLLITLKQSPGEITGSVKAEDGNLLTGAIVTLAPDPPKPNQNYLSRRVETDQNGKFQLSDLAPGQYRIFAWEDLPNFAELDPDFLGKHLGNSTAITVEDASKQSVSLTVRLLEK